MDKEAFARGFVTRCNELGADPEEIFKTAQAAGILNTLGRFGRGVVGSPRAFSKEIAKLLGHGDGSPLPTNRAEAIGELAGILGIGGAGVYGAGQLAEAALPSDLPE
jgi:hypothetical protein